MSKIEKALNNIEILDDLARGDGYVNNVHPLAKLIVTVFFLVVTVSFPNGDLTGLLGIGIVLFIVFTIADLSFYKAIIRIRYILPFILIMGIFNPIFDREQMFVIGGVAVSRGFITMLSLIIKGIYTVLFSYVLIATTTMESLCYAMRLIKIPKLIVTEFMLIYRYIQLLLRESDKVITSYFLRAPGQKGVHISAWGSLVGLMLIRCIDRAEMIYKSMCLRGYTTDIFYCNQKKIKAKDVIFALALIISMLLLRKVYILELVGRIFIN